MYEVQTYLRGIYYTSRKASIAKVLSVYPEAFSFQWSAVSKEHCFDMKIPEGIGVGIPAIDVIQRAYMELGK